MAYVALERMIDKNPSLYKLVLTAAERANQIARGSKLLVETDSKKPTTQALNEMVEGKVRYELDDKK